MQSQSKLDWSFKYYINRLIPSINPSILYTRFRLNSLTQASVLLRKNCLLWLIDFLKKPFIGWKLCLWPIWNQFWKSHIKDFKTSLLIGWQLCCGKPEEEKWSCWITSILTRTFHCKTYQRLKSVGVLTQIAKFMGPTWGPPGSCWPQMGPMLASWTLLSRLLYHWTH